MLQRLLDVVAQGSFVDLLELLELDVFRDLAHALEQAVLVLELGAARDGERDVLFGGTDDGDDVLDAPDRDAVGDVFGRVGRLLAGQAVIWRSISTMG